MTHEPLPNHSPALVHLCQYFKLSQSRHPLINHSDLRYVAFTSFNFERQTLMKHTPKTISSEEIIRIYDHFKTCKYFYLPKIKRPRNMLLFLLMIDAGLRVGEVIKLNLHDLLAHGEPVGNIIVRAEIAKTHHERMIPVSPRLNEAILNAMHYMPNWFAMRGDTYAFLGCKLDQHMTARSVQIIIAIASKKAIGRVISPHVLRHTFASRLLKVSNIRVVQQLLGHRQLGSTMIYTHPSQDDRVAAIANM